MNLHKAFKIILGDITQARVFTHSLKDCIVVNGDRPGEIFTFNSLSSINNIGEIAFVSNLRGMRRFYWEPRQTDHLMNSVVLSVSTKPLVRTPVGKKPVINITIDYSMAGRTRP